jgi:mannose-1-phosphate guanylyltransferase
LKAVVLVGGEGTRMRPLTYTTPKPLLPLVDRPSLSWVLEHLAAHGVSHAILSSPYLEEMFTPFVRGREDRPPAITWITEEQPLGTGGAILNALGELGDEPFFALNGDIITDLDLTRMNELHRTSSAAATIALHHVDDARAFGLVNTDAHGRVEEFREKPEDEVAGDINAGTYILDPPLLGDWPSDEPVSIERQIFPDMIDRGLPLRGFPSDAYWIDLGTPEKYLQAQFDMLEGKVSGASFAAPFIDVSASIDNRAHLGRWVVAGPEVRVEADAEIEDSVLLQGAAVGAFGRITGTVLGPGASVGEGSSLTGCVLGGAVSVPAGQTLEGVRIPDPAVA